MEDRFSLRAIIQIIDESIFVEKSIDGRSVFLLLFVRG